MFFDGQVGDALGQLRRAVIEIVLEVDVDPHVVRAIGRHVIVEKNGRRLETPIDRFMPR